MKYFAFAIAMASVLGILSSVLFYFILPLFRSKSKCYPEFRSEGGHTKIGLVLMHTLKKYRYDYMFFAGKQSRLKTTIRDSKGRFCKAVQQ